MKVPIGKWEWLDLPHFILLHTNWSDVNYLIKEGSSSREFYSQWLSSSLNEYSSDLIHTSSLRKQHNHLKKLPQILTFGAGPGV